MEKSIRINQRTFEQIYRLYAGKLYRICFRELQDADEAANLVHDVYTSLWERRGGLVIDNPEHYLVHAAKLQIINYFRNQQTRKAHLRDIADQPEADHSTENSIAFHSLQKQIEQLLEQLPARCQEVYRMHQDTGLPNREIACRLRMSESSVRQHLAKAKYFLREHLRS